jgi:hypothetical protein
VALTTSVAGLGYPPPTWRFHVVLPWRSFPLIRGKGSTVPLASRTTPFVVLLRMKFPVIDAWPAPCVPIRPTSRTPSVFCSIVLWKMLSPTVLPLPGPLAETPRVRLRKTLVSSTGTLVLLGDQITRIPEAARLVPALSTVLRCTTEALSSR